MKLVAGISRMAPWRRIAAVAALIALLFAATVSSISHSMAMAGDKTGGASTELATLHSNGISASGDHHANAQNNAQPMMDKDSAGDAHAKGLSHDHATQTDTDNSAPGNCDQGCILCKDCALCGLFGVQAWPLTTFAAQYAGYRPSVSQALAGITPALPSEPPRV